MDESFNEKEEEIAKAINEVRDTVTKWNRVDILDSSQSIASFSQSLKEKFSAESCQKCILWHAMVGSSSIPKEEAVLDFPGEFSILEFVRNGFKKALEN